MTDKPEGNDADHKEVTAPGVADKTEGAVADAQSAANVGSEQKDPKKEPKKKPVKAPEKEKSGSGRLVLLLLLFIILLVAGGGGYFFWQQSQSQGQQLATVNTQLDKQYQQITRLEQSLANAQQKLQSQRTDDQALLQAISQRLDSHNKRLLSMSSTSREDWLLAEAEYLLRLANQRLLMERGTRGAQALLEAADNILRGLDDVDLFPVRKALARDLAALKLAGQVDREGLYLRLAVLAEQAEQLDVLAPDQIAPTLIREVEETTTAPESLWSRFRQSLAGALQKLGGYVRIRQRGEPVEPLLSPQEQLYLNQNLRLMLERAQLAMLREEPEIYRHSLAQAQRWLRTYYRLNEESPVLQQALVELQQIPIAQELPNIAGSLSQLKAYIERLHKLGGSEAKAAAAKAIPANKEKSP